MNKTGAVVVFLRIILEIISFLNFKYICNSVEVPKTFFVYTTHSFCGIFLVVDLLRHRAGLLRTVERRTGIRKETFLTNTFFLSFLLNIISFSRALTFNSLSDMTITVLSCSSLIFTKLFFERQRAASFRGNCLTFVIILGMILVIVREKKYMYCSVVLVTSFMSSFYDFVYKEMTKIMPTLEERIIALKHRKEEITQSLEKSRI